MDSLNNDFVDFVMVAGIVVFIVAVVVIPVMLIMWSKQKQSLGTIKCNRCNHVGPPQGMWVPFRGMKPVCSMCQSDDWVKVQ